MNNSNQAVRVGLFFILGVAILLVLLTSLGETKIGATDAYPIKASFSNLRQLRPGDEVRMAGVHIGNVNKTILERGNGIAILGIDNAVDIPKDSLATIATSGLLGNNYVAISYGSSINQLSPEDIIKTENTADLNEVISQLGDIGTRVNGFLAKLEDVMGEFNDDGAPSTLFGNLNDLIVSNKENLNATIANLSKLTTKVSKGEGSLGRLINDDDAYNTLINTAGEVRQAASNATELFSDANAIMLNLKEGKGTLGVLLNDERIASDIRDSLSNIKDFSKKLNNDKSTLGRIISSDDLYLEAQGTLNKVNTAVDGMNDSGPISAVGAAASALF